MASRTVQVPPERLPGWLDRFAERHGPGTVIALGSSVELAAPDGAIAELEVPFPPLRPDSDPLTALVAHARRERTVGVLLVRRVGYAAGVFRGSELLSSKVGSGYVQSRTKAGGWSQQRFARRRANQAQAIWGDAADVADRILVPRLAELDAVVAGGDQAGVAAVLGDPRLAALRPLVQGATLSVPDPRLSVLTATPQQFRAVRIRLNDLA
jgi:hypothetical protein